MIFCTCL